MPHEILKMLETLIFYLNYELGDTLLLGYCWNFMEKDCGFKDNSVELVSELLLL